MELNPHHPTTKAARDNWHKIAAVLMAKLKTRHVVLSVEDIKAIQGENISMQELPDGLHLRLVSDEEAHRLARQHGGVSLS